MRFLLAVTALVCLVGVNGQSNPFFNLDDLNLNFDFSNFGTSAARTPVLTKPAAGDKELTSAHLDGITTQFANMFNNQPDKLPPYVQMLFHLCVGKAGCDGCLDTTQKDNFRLKTDYAELRRLWNTWKSVISLADFGVLAGYAAVKVGVSRDSCNGRQCSIALDFTAGRKTCSNPNKPPKTTFPHGEDPDSPIDFVKKPFGLSNRETVALLGCHSVGNSHSDVSGFVGDWDLSPNVLNNGYFQALDQITNWDQSIGSGGGKIMQWNGKSADGTSLTMLHSDMVLKRKINVNSKTNVATCSNGEGSKTKLKATSCPLQNANGFAGHVKSFANNNQLFVQTLASAVVKMTNTATFDSKKKQTFTDGG